MARERTQLDEEQGNDHIRASSTIDRRSYLKATGTTVAAAGLLSGAVSAQSGDTRDVDAGAYHVNGWYPAWAWWDDYRPSDIPFDILDFVSIADFTPQTDGTVEFTYGGIETHVLEGFQQVDRKGSNVLMCIGGGRSSQYFADAASTPSRRETFVETTIDFLRTYDLDGVDIDWEFPLTDGGSDAENETQRQNFMALLERLRERLDEIGNQDGKYYYLAAALSPQPWRAREHDTQRLGELLDFAGIMTYIFVGEWSPETDHDAPLFSENDDGVHRYPTSSHVAVQAWIDEGIPAEKVNLGVKTVGAVFNGVPNGGTNGLGQSWSSFVDNKPGYAEIVDQYLNNSSYDTFWDSTAQVPWTYSDTEETFVTHDNPRSVERKSEYVANQGLHGIIFWNLDDDTADHELIRTAYDSRAEHVTDSPPEEEEDGEEEEEEDGEEEQEEQEEEEEDGEEEQEEQEEEKGEEEEQEEEDHEEEDGEEEQEEQEEEKGEEQEQEEEDHEEEDGEEEEEEQEEDGEEDHPGNGRGRDPKNHPGNGKGRAIGLLRRLLR